MKLSSGFWQTYKEVPADAEIPSHQLMVRAGLIHKMGSGLYSYLPFGYRSIRKVEQIIREELDKAGCHEILMSMVTPGELWQESGRWDAMGDQMLKVKDKGGRDLCLSPTNEEAVTDIFRKTIKSYKNLPVTVYQINTKFRDELRPRFGLMRGREFTMKDAYSFHADKDSLDEVYDRLFKAYEAIFTRAGLEFSAVEADGGAMADSDQKTHEFQVIADTGEDEVIYCAETGYAANIEKAQTKRANINFDKTNSEIKEVATPSMSTIEDVCNFLKTPKEQSLKSLVYKSVIDEKEETILVLLLGDDSLNELKLSAFLKGDLLKAAVDSELLNEGFVKGYIGPHDLSSKARIIFDSQIDLEASYTAGANKVDTHFQGLVPKRDVSSFEVADLRLATKGDLTLDGKGVVDIRRGIEVGHIFQLGDKYTKAMSTTVLDSNGKTMHPLMGCYGIGVTRVVAAAVEQHHDDKGIVWPMALAPYHVYYAEITKSAENKELADKIYHDLLEAGIEVVFDDRKAGPGFKFKDADLLGLPIQLIFGERDFKNDGMLEIRIRKTGESFKVLPSEVVEKIKGLIEGSK
ncbi:proline--tRNA ligase [Halobacteriovorax sp. JY17]|uniref:proline--tRNA ligase n=1 Tax=Halobacteriovorax sp. JY17 TaxID=2014617 RepID=UPI000C63754D|nr:proline--tRNA ligase [Halobacteriovorax sp. JY17]PIK14202.1 MAG: proline--tRNA ligase [Halobacteriovorax sp. JY17]